MDGHGNATAAARRKALEALRTTYEDISAQIEGWSKPHQAWVLIDPEDSGQDAAYVHTPNPNRDNFPYTFEGVDWAATVPKWIVSTFPRNLYRLGKSKYRGNVCYWAQRHDT